MKRLLMILLLVSSPIAALFAQQFYNTPTERMFDAEGYSLRGYESTVQAAGPELIGQTPLALRTFGKPRGRNGFWETEYVMADGQTLVLVTQVLPEGNTCTLRMGIRASAWEETTGRELEALSRQLLQDLHARHYKLLIAEAQTALDHIQNQLDRISRDSVNIVERLEDNARDKERLEKELALNAKEKENLEREQALKAELKDLRQDEKSVISDRLRQLQAILEEIE